MKRTFVVAGTVVWRTTFVIVGLIGLVAALAMSLTLVLLPLGILAFLGSVFLLTAAFVPRSNQQKGVQDGKVKA